MLNHIWLWMIVLSILIAGGTDVFKEITAPQADGQEVVQRNLNKDTKLGQVTQQPLNRLIWVSKLRSG